ncbi:hypothetical protein BDR26DRAFT_919483 [Obelidium mucronatum]|nr:hypothetical protein BDR26DRAFT_919483 [Obelidium mucronatum]
MVNVGSASLEKFLALHGCGSESLECGAALVLYVRKSVESTSHSCQQQQDFVKDWAASKGFHITAVFEEVESGAKSDRLQLEAALKRVLGDSSISGLVTYKVDRLSRDGGFTKAVLARLSSGGKFYISAAEPDLFFAPGQSEANPQLALLLRSTLAEAERINISKTTAHHMLMKKNAGCPVSNKSPYGTQFCARYSNGRTIHGYFLNSFSKDGLIEVSTVPCPKESLLALAALAFSWNRFSSNRRLSHTAIFNYVAALGMEMETRPSAKPRPIKRQVYNFSRNVQSYLKQAKEKRLLDQLVESLGAPHHSQ